MVAEISLHIDAHRPLRADRVDLAFLQRAQQLDLQIERQFADFVEKQRAAIGLEEFSDVLFGGAGEGALLVAEQNRLDEIGRQRAAIDRDEGLAAAIRGALNGARDDLLADAGFALDQHRNGRMRRALAKPDDAGHFRAARDEILEGQKTLRALADAAHFAGERVDRQGVLDRDLQPLGADRLDDEVLRAGAHRGNHRLYRAMRGLHDDRRRELELAHAAENAHAVEIGHHEIEHEQGDRRGASLGHAEERLFAAFDGLDFVTETPRHCL